MDARGSRLWLRRRRTASPKPIPAPTSPAPTRFASCSCWPAKPFRKRARRRSRLAASSPSIPRGCRPRPATADARGWWVPRVLQDDHVHLEVKPTLVDAAHPFAQIRNEENCLLIASREARVSGEPAHVWTGRGAGRWPTTAAVMADLFDLARELRASSRELRAASKASDSSSPAIKPPASEGVFQLAADNRQPATDIGGVA